MNAILAVLERCRLFQGLPPEVLERCEVYENLPGETQKLYSQLWVELGTD